MGISERVQEAWGFVDDDSECAESGIHRKVVEPTSTLDRLFSASSCLGTSSGKEELLTCMARVKAFLDTTSVAELFFDLFDDASAVRAVTQLVSHVEHVGLIIPQAVARDLAFAAATAGFRLTPMIGPSAVVARELGSLIGRESVPTTIFKASAQSTAGHQIRFEAFIPSDVEDRVVNGWISRNVASHVAVLVDDLSSMEELERLFLSQGYTMPAFMNGKPMVNRVEKVTVMYFDRVERGRTLRVECCCCDVA